MLARWNGYGPRWSSGTSWDALSDLRREMNELFSEFDRYWLSAGPLRSFGAADLPPMELTDERDALSLRLEVPGFKEKDLQIDLNRSALTIRGERRTEVPEGYSVHRRERGELKFARTLTLPCRVQPDGVRATLHNGVLELRLPKAPEEQPRTIEVHSAD